MEVKVNKETGINRQNIITNCQRERNRNQGSATEWAGRSETIRCEAYRLKAENIMSKKKSFAFEKHLYVSKNRKILHKRHVSVSKTLSNTSSSFSYSNVPTVPASLFNTRKAKSHHYYTQRSTRTFSSVLFCLGHFTEPQ